MFRRSILISTVVFATMVCASPVLAQDETEQVDSQTKRFNARVAAAKTAYDQANYRDAIESLRAAFRIKENPRLLLNIARSYEKMGDCARALVYYRSYLNHPEAEEAFSKVAKKRMSKRETCSQFSDDLAGRLTILTLPRGATVKFNGRAVGETPIELVGAMSGDHELTLEKEGYETEKQLVRLDPAEDELLRFELTEGEPEPTQEEPVVEKLAEPEEDGFQVDPYALGVAGAGGAMLVVGLVYDLAVIPSTDREREPYPRGTPEFDRLTAERKRQATTAVVSYVIGGALVAGGGGWILYEYSQHQESEKKDPLMVLTPGPGDVGAGVTLRF
ncbi:MAG: PEGA domain-containing protein [Myxococcota bacterium]